VSRFDWPTASPGNRRSCRLALDPVVIEDGRVLIEIPDGPVAVNE